MGVSFHITNKILFALGVIFQLWFILMYALDYGYLYYPLGTAAQ